MGHVREVGARGSDALCGFDGLRKVHVRGMRIVAESVENQYFDAVKQRPGIIGHDAAVRAIGEFAEAKTKYRHWAVQQGNGDDFVTSDLKWSPVEFVKRQVRSRVR